MLPWKSCKLKIKLAFKLGKLPVFASVGENIFVLICCSELSLTPLPGSKSTGDEAGDKKGGGPKESLLYSSHRAWPQGLPPVFWLKISQAWLIFKDCQFDWLVFGAQIQTDINPSAWGTQHFTLNRHFQPLPLISASVTDKLRLINVPLNYVSVHSCRWILNMSFGQNEHR